jgi:hypothetical protein
MADDTDHAEEQCLNAYPDADIVWVCVDVAYLDALNDYHGTIEDGERITYKK